MHLVRPKTPLMIFFELYKDIPINVEQTLSENGMHYTASIVVSLIFIRFSFLASIYVLIVV